MADELCIVINMAGGIIDSVYAYTDKVEARDMANAMNKNTSPYRRSDDYSQVLKLTPDSNIYGKILYDVPHDSDSDCSGCQSEYGFADEIPCVFCHNSSHYEEAVATNG
jgi:hypothetical protein